MSPDELLVLDVDSVASLLPRLDLGLALGTALVAIAEERVSAPPRQSALTRSGKLTAMPNAVAGVGLSCKLMAVFPDQEPYSHSGAVAAFDPGTGQLLALVDASLLTAVRTAAVTRVAVEALDPSTTGTAVVLGDGTQAQAHLRELAGLGSWERIVCVARSDRRREAIEAIDPRIVLAPEAEPAVREADLVIACTSSPTPVVADAWLRPGTVLASVGGGHELAAETVATRRLFVEWPGAARFPSPAGAQELQGLPPDRLTLVGDVLRGARPGRQDGDEVLVYKGTGLGVEDTVVVAQLIDLAGAENLGALVPWPRGHR